MNLFSRFFQENQEKFLAFAYPYLRDKAEAEDVVMESMIALWENRDRWEENSNLHALLLTIIKNKALHVLEHKQVRLRAEETISSHNLRELEDICDHVGLLHRGGILFSRDLDEMKLGMYKVQCIFGAPLPEDAWNGFDLLKKEQRGSLYTITARGERDELIAKINKMNPTFCELLPLTLEEIFINETEVAGYDVKKLLF